MSENPEEPKRPEELKKLAAVATDMDYPSKIRIDSIDHIGDLGGHEALLVLLELAANEKLNVAERDLALKRAREIIKSGH